MSLSVSYRLAGGLSSPCSGAQDLMGLLTLFFFSLNKTLRTNMLGVMLEQCLSSLVVLFGQHMSWMGVDLKNACTKSPPLPTVIESLAIFGSRAFRGGPLPGCPSAFGKSAFTRPTHPHTWTSLNSILCF